MRGGKIEKKHLQGHFSRSSSHDPNWCRHPLLTPPAAFTLTTTFARCTATSAILQILPKPYGTFTCIFTVRNEVSKVMFLHLCVCPQGGASSLLGDSGRFEGGAPGACLPTAQNFLNFMQFFAKFGKIICWRPLQRVGAPSYGESWICPWGGLVPGGSAPRGVCYWGGCLVPGRGSAPGGECLDLVVSGGIPACTEADPPPGRQLLLRTVRILLERMLVRFYKDIIANSYTI